MLIKKISINAPADVKSNFQSVTINRKEKHTLCSSNQIIKKGGRNTACSFGQFQNFTYYICNSK